MSTTSERLRSYWGERQISTDRFAALATQYWEIAAFGLIVGIALGLRLWDLGARAVHHDESLHMLYSWQLFKGQGYEHVPFMHGPLQFYLSAVAFRLFGDNDYTARLMYALAGSAMVAAPYFLRNYIGRVGALTAALLLAFSPSLMYFSRFARGDIYMAAFTLGMAIVIWRYLRERKENYLYWVAPLLVLSFLTIEFTFFTVAIFLIYLEFELAYELLRQAKTKHELDTPRSAAAWVFFLVFGWAIMAIWPLTDKYRERFALTEFPAAGDLIVLLGTFSVPLFGPGFDRVLFLNNGFYQDVAGGENPEFWFTTIILLFATAYVGILWKPRVWLISAAAFYIPFVLLFTTGFTNMAGFKSGMWGSLDYWLEQQGVRRGDQPDYYYFITTPVYEFLPLIFALGGTLYYAFKGRIEQALGVGAVLLATIIILLMPDFRFHLQLCMALIIAAVLFLRIESFTKFLLYWTLSIMFVLTTAGEKMPWLTIHLAVPLALLAAKIIDDIVSGVPAAFAKKPAPEEEPAKPARRGRAPVKVEEPAPAPTFSWENALPLLYAGIAALLAGVFFQAVGPAAPLSIIPWLLALAAAAVVVRTAMQVSRRAAAQVAAVALFAALVPFTLRAAGFASYDQGDPDGYPQEMLIYAQGSPKLNVINDQITRVANDSGLGKDLPVIIDGSDNIWPWPWYMRNRPYESSNFDGEFEPKPGQVVLISTAHQAKMQPYLDQYYEGIPYTHMWWFPEFYRGLNVTGFLSDVFSGHYWKSWRAYMIDRDVAGANEQPNMIAYFPKSFDAPVIDRPPAAADTLPATSVTAVGDGAGSAPGQFTEPGDLFVDSSGQLFIVDTLNHRIQRMGTDGQFDAFGEQGAEEGQFANPFSDQYQVNDGPWGVTTDAAGNIYVADTWNGRIQVFDKDFKFLREWGRGELFGPRDVAIDSEGNVLVSDTGNNRVVKYSPDGQLMQSYGKSGDNGTVSGSGPAEFHEPAGIFVTSDGDIYIADFWNQRIQVFDPQMQYRTEVSVESWPKQNSTAITDRAYVTVLDDGHVLATDPSNSRIIAFDETGKQISAWKLPSDTGVTRPVGIAVAGDQAYISDGFANRVVKVPVSTLLAPSGTAQ